MASLKDSGLVLPSPDDLTPSFVEIVGVFCQLVTQQGADTPSSQVIAEDYGTGLWESEELQLFFEIMGETPPKVLTEQGTIGEVRESLSAGVKACCYLFTIHRDTLMQYALLKAVRDETSHLYAKHYPMESSPHDHDYLCGANSLLATLVKHQNRNYQQIPKIKYNELTASLEMTYSIPEATVVNLMRTGKE